MSVYRELAAELRANKAVIDSLNSRNQQLIQQNQRLKQEIHNVVQATLNLGQFAGVARQAPGSESAEFSREVAREVPGAIAPDTLAKLVRAQGEARKTIPSEPVDAQSNTNKGYTDSTPAIQPPITPQTVAPQTVAPQSISPSLSEPFLGPASTYSVARQPKAAPIPAPQPRRVPRPIPPRPLSKSAPQTKGQSRPSKASSAARKQSAKSAVKAPTQQRSSAIVPQAKQLPKLFTEQSGEYRSSALSSGEDKEIGGIWLALSIILIIVTAFGAGFLIMKPLLNDR